MKREVDWRVVSDLREGCLDYCPCSLAERERESRIFNFKGHGFMHTVGALHTKEARGGREGK